MFINEKTIINFSLSIVET